MNCQETHCLFDATPEQLTRLQREAADRHLASCPACRAELANWEEIVGLPVPATPATLRARITAALIAQAAPPRRLFRPFVVGGFLLAGAALAAMFLPLRSQSPVEPVAAASSAAVPAVSVAEGSAVSESAMDSPGPQPAVAPAAAAVVPLDPRRVVVLRRPEAAADVNQAAFAARCHDAVVRELRYLGGLSVVTHDAAFTLASFEERVHLPERDQKIARDLGAAHALVITTDGGCSVTLLNTLTGDIVQGAGGSGVDPQGDRLDVFARGMAYAAHDKLLNPAGTGFAQARAVIVNSGLGDRERMSALWKIVSNSRGQQGKALPEFFDKDVIAAIVYLGTKSSDVQVREGMWAGLRDFVIDDPSLPQALMQSLASDLNEMVRYQAALTLNRFLDKPGVLAALQRAAAEDPSREPRQECCTLTVREAAQRASVANKDFRGWARSMLFDESLPARSRLLQVVGWSPDGRFSMLAQSDTEAARVVFDIGRREQNPAVRAMAWDSLRGAATNESFVPVLVQDLTSNPDQNVRANAAQVLQRYADNPDVRRAFEQVLNDQSIEVRRVAVAVTQQPGK